MMTLLTVSHRGVRQYRRQGVPAQFGSLSDAREVMSRLVSRGSWEARLFVGNRLVEVCCQSPDGKSLCWLGSGV